jgi:hypothetical protein
MLRLAGLLPFLLLPATIAAQLPDELARERREYSEWLANAATSPYAAVAVQPVRTAIEIGPADADIPLDGVARHRLVPANGGATLEGSGGRRPLARGRVVPLGRYRLVLGGAPGRNVVTVFEPGAKPSAAPGYFGYDAHLVFTVPLEPPAQPQRGRVLAADGTEVDATEAGTVTLNVGGRSARLRVLRLPGASADESGLEIFFRDATNGRGSYPAGRFVALDPADDGRVRVDFNRARNPFCAYNTVYPCPAPWRGNTVDAPIAAGERYERKATTNAAVPTR